MLDWRKLMLLQNLMVSVLSKTFISKQIRELVAKRANNICEYCLIPIAFGFLNPYQIDHIISEKHGGSSDLDNLAFACKTCNALKGSDLATYLHDQELTVRLYHPRKDVWSNHFELNQSGALSSKTNVGLATIQLLNLNDDSYIKLRYVLLAGGTELTTSTKE